MHTYVIQKGTTNIAVELEIVDDSDGTPETGVVWNTAGINLQYRRDSAVNTAITEATLGALTTAHTDGGFLHIGNGIYRFDLPDAACASGVDRVLVHGIVTGMVVIPCVIQLVDYDPFDGVQMGMTAISGIQSDTDDIQTRLPSALINGRMDSDVEAINNLTASAVNLAQSALGIVPGVVEGTPTTTVIVTDLAEATDDHYIGRVMVFLTGAAAYQASDIVDYNGSTGTIVVTVMTTAPSASDTFVII